MLCYIYKVTSPSGRIYIGQTTDIVERKGSYKRGDCKNQKLLYPSIKLHGWDNHTFEIVEERKIGEYSKEILDALEIYYIGLYKSNKLRYPYKNGMNLTDGGAGMRGFKHTEYTKRKLTRINLGINNNFYGKVHSIESRKLISEKNKGKIMSVEARNKISISNKGKILSEDEVMKRVLRNGCGKIISVYRAHDIIRGNRRNPISVVKGELVIEGYNKGAICRELGVSQTVMNRCLNGNVLSYRDYIFEYKN